MDDTTPCEIAEWQIAAIMRAIESLDRGEGIPHEQVVAWVKSWGSRRELPMPTPAKPKHKSL